MVTAVYRIVEHDGGWAYKLGDVFSETFPNREAAAAAAARVAELQSVPGEDEPIEWEDERSVWHTELARGRDRPYAYVEPMMASPPAKAGNAMVVTLALAGALGALLAMVIASRRSHGADAPQR